MDRKDIKRRDVILVCNEEGKCARRCKAMKAAVKKELAARKLDKRIRVLFTECLGECKKGVVVMTPTDGSMWTEAKKADAADIVDAVADKLPKR